MELERTKALYDEDMVTAIAQSVLHLQANRFHAAFGRFPQKSEPVFFVVGEDEPRPLPYQELLAMVVGYILGEPALGLERVDLARPFAILVLLRLGLSAAAA